MNPREIKTYVHTQTYTECSQKYYSIIIPKKWKQPEYSSTHEWINKILPIHTMGYYLVIKRNEVLTYATTWMNLENTTLNDIYIYHLLYIQDISQYICVCVYIQYKSHTV